MTKARSLTAAEAGSDQLSDLLSPILARGQAVIEAAIEHLIAYLDASAGDPDLEAEHEGACPFEDHVAGKRGRSGIGDADDAEANGDDEPNTGDDEPDVARPSLGYIGTGSIPYAVDQEAPRCDSAPELALVPERLDHEAARGRPQQWLALDPKGRPGIWSLVGGGRGGAA